MLPLTKIDHSLSKLFLAVKFSKNDAKNVEARIRSTSRIHGVTAATSKGIRQKLNAEEYREQGGRFVG